MIHVKRTSSDNPDFCSLIQMLDKDLRNRYPETQHKYAAFNLIQPDANVLVAYDDGIAAGCGCFRDAENENVVEIKRMYVKEGSRGKGIAKSVLMELEAWAREEGKQAAVLETGPNNQEALSLYKQTGYERIDNYGPYVNMKESICIGKDLTKKPL